MTISVVIATYERAARLDACLARLSSQDFEVGDEIVVADNGSADATPQVLASWTRRHPDRIRIVEEPRPGKSLAVAAALRGCRADVLAFTDDDVAVGEGWLAGIRRAMSGRDVALVGGRVLPMYEARVPDWLDLGGPSGFGRMASPLGLLDYGSARQPLGARAALGANLAVRREAFEAVGGYADHLGKLRGTLLSGEDHQLCERIQASGYTAVYDPSIWVRHLVPAERLRPGYFMRWFFWSGVTHATMDRARAVHARTALWGVPGHVLKQLGLETLAAAGALLRASWPSVADHATRAAFAAGYAWNTWRARLARPAAAPRARVEAA